MRIWVPLEAKNLLFNVIFNVVNVANTELQDIIRLMGYIEILTDICIKDAWIGFSVKNFAKQAVVHHTFIAS